MWQRRLDYNIGSKNNTASKNKSIVNGLRYHRRVYRTIESWRKLNCPDQQWYPEPWLQLRRQMCQPDGVLVDPLTNTGIVIEVKLNWKDGRDEKLLNLYLEASQQAFALDCVWPALITSNVAGYRGKPRLGLSALPDCCDWQPGHLTPVLLLP